MSTYAKVTKRVLAFIVDGCLILCLQSLMLALLMTLHLVFSDGFFALLVLLNWLPIAWLYYALFESSSWQGTCGKKLFAIKVVDVYGQRISFGRASLRFLGKWVGASLLWVGFLMVLFTKQKQGLHDKIARTYVIPKLSALGESLSF